MIGRFFRAHGKFCASHPWEVIVALLTVTACILTLDKQNTVNEVSPSTFGNVQQSSLAPTDNSNRHRATCFEWDQNCEALETDYNAADIIFMTIIRCTAVLYCYYQFCGLQKLGSKYILGIAGIFTVFSSFIFTTTIIKFLGRDISDLKDAIFFLVLLIDLSNSGILAQLALSGRTQAEVTHNIAHGMEILAPSITLDTIVEALVIGVGTLSGVQRLEVLCTFAVLSVLVNYVVFMTFYPACLSLVLDLSRNGMDMSLIRSKTKNSMLLNALNEEEQKANPVVQRVKVIMTTGLMIVHIYSRIVFSNNDFDTMENRFESKLNLNKNVTESMQLKNILMKWLTVSADQIVVLILVIALVMKFIFFERRDDLHDQLRQRTRNNKNVLTFEKSALTELNLINATTQTDIIQHYEQSNLNLEKKYESFDSSKRSLQECIQIVTQSIEGATNLNDAEILQIIDANSQLCPLHKIESVVGDAERGVRLRRQVICTRANVPANLLNTLPYENFDYRKVLNVCCENVLGYVPIPVGYAGPLLLDGKQYYVPMATTEGALVASTNRGCKALSVRGVTSYVEDVGMTRAPCVRFASVTRAAEVKRWIDDSQNYKIVKAEFDSTSRFGRLKECLVAMDGPQLYIRFVALTGDAMGMNMVSKGAEMALKCIKKQFPDMQIISLSGNFCCDKKPAAINWIKGRGKRVIAECVVPANTLRTVLKTDAKTLVDCNKMKNMGGSAMAGTIGGNNAHAANMVTAVFLATGQDPAQNVTSSNCSTGMECWGDSNDDLYITCTMPSLEVGTVGGGTGLPGQGACLDMLGLKGANLTHPGENAKKLAQIICATVMAGELSLMAALVNSDLVKSHMKHNRSVATINKVDPLITSLSGCNNIS